MRYQELPEQGTLNVVKRKEIKVDATMIFGTQGISEVPYSS